MSRTDAYREFAAEQAAMERAEDAAERSHIRRMAALSRERCRCGGDMPGRCPGPASCPMCQSGPDCRVCGIETRHRQDADDTWICADCEGIEA